MGGGEGGFETAVVDGRNQGFFHGTGHGVGLDIHEPPRIGNVEHTLKAGQVVTVEPGLYYPRGAPFVSRTWWWSKRWAAAT
jgi:Xaa-Pro aminopeptidase